MGNKVLDMWCWGLLICILSIIGFTVFMGVNV